MRAIDHIGSAFLRRILRRMRELGVNQSELAKRMKVSKPYITKVLHEELTTVNRKVYNTHCQMTHRADNLDFRSLFPCIRDGREAHSR